MTILTSYSYGILFLAYSVMFRGLLCSSENGFLIRGREIAENSDLHHTSHTIRLDTLLPKDSCQSTNRDVKNGSSIDVVDIHGPCNLHQLNAPTHGETFTKNRMRISSINKGIFMNPEIRSYNSVMDMVVQSKYSIGHGYANYIVLLGIGTSKSDQLYSFIIDTTSQFTWLKCKKIRSKQAYVPRWSDSNTNIQSISPFCFQLNSTPGIWSTNCGAGSLPCKYELRTRNNRLIVGDLNKDKLTLTQDNTFENFLFGCSYATRKQRLQHGVLGLGAHKLSLVHQTAKTSNKVFSYCLPSVSSYTGYLRFGDKSTSDNVKYTPLVLQNSAFYGLNVIGVSVGGKILPIMDKVLQETHTVIDSGIEITQLPYQIYRTMRAEFLRRMDYPMMAAYFALETCYDVTNYESITIPTVSFHFEGGSKVDIHPSGILYIANKSQVCLAFSRNPSTNNVIILGNMMQKTIDVVYDVGNQRIGFGPGSCN